MKPLQESFAMLQDMLYYLIISITVQEFTFFSQALHSLSPWTYQFCINDDIILTLQTRYLYVKSHIRQGQRLR